MTTWFHDCERGGSPRSSIRNGILEDCLPVLTEQGDENVVVGRKERSEMQ